MTESLYYFILKNYKGLLRKKHKSNNHLFLVPTGTKKYMYLAIIGKLEDEENTYVAQLLVRISDDIVDKMIEGEKDYFSSRFVEVEKLNCKVLNPSSGEYIVKLKEKGENILSNLEINYQVEYSTNARRLYFIKGDLNLITEEVNEKDMKMVANKQSAFIGDKKRFEESKKYKKTKILREDKIMLNEKDIKIIAMEFVFHSDLPKKEKIQALKLVKDDLNIHQCMGLILDGKIYKLNENGKQELEKRFVSEQEELTKYRKTVHSLRKNRKN